MLRACRSITNPLWHNLQDTGPNRNIQKQYDTKLFYNDELKFQKIVQACYQGRKTIKFTHRGDFAHEVFRELFLLPIIHFQE